MKKSLARKVVRTGVIAAGILLAAGSASAAHAADLTTTDNYFAGNGNQVAATWQAPISVCGNAGAGIGVANAYCKGGAAAHITKDALNNLYSANNYGLVNGNQVDLTAQTPIDVSGNALGIIGLANASSVGGSDATIGKSNAPAESARVEETATDMVTHDNYFGGSGNQVAGTAQIPVTVCGNAGAGIGVANASCDGKAKALLKPNGTPNMTTYQNVGLVNGNQVAATLQAPISVCGNAVAIIGVANANCVGGSTAQIGYSDSDHTKAVSTKSASGTTRTGGSLSGVLG